MASTYSIYTRIQKLQVLSSKVYGKKRIQVLDTIKTLQAELTKRQKQVYATSTTGLSAEQQAQERQVRNRSIV